MVEFSENFNNDNEKDPTAWINITIEKRSKLKGLMIGGFPLLLSILIDETKVWGVLYMS